MEHPSVHGDNQQERLDSDVQWLAGIIDSEGTIGYYQDHGAYIGVSNCETLLIDQVQAILKKLGILCRLQTRNRNLKWKISYVIQVTSIKSCKSILKKITPYLQGKQEVAKTVYSLCLRRQKKHTQKYSKPELQLLQKVKVLNSKGVQNPQRLHAEHENENSLKIQSGLYGDIQSAAEMTAPTLSWFGGMVDGDGCITFEANHKGWSPAFIVTNSNKALIESTVQLLKQQELPYYIKTKFRKSKKHKVAYDVKVSGLKRIQKILKILFPYLRVKNRQAALIQEFIGSRQQKPKNEKYASNELALIKKVKALNSRGQ